MRNICSFFHRTSRAAAEAFFATGFRTSRTRGRRTQRGEEPGSAIMRRGCHPRLATLSWRFNFQAILPNSTTGAATTAFREYLFPAEPCPRAIAM